VVGFDSAGFAPLPSCPRCCAPPLPGPRRPATCVPGTRPAPRFKSGGAHQTAVRRAPSPAAPRACSTRPHATWARTKNSTPGPHPQSTPTRTRAQHSRTHTHTHTHTHGAWHTAHVAGRAGGRARRVGASGGTAASPRRSRSRRVRLTCERGGHRGRTEGAGARQRNGRDARRTMQGRQVGGLAVAGRSGGAAPFWSASRG